MDVIKLLEYGLLDAACDTANKNPKRYWQHVPTGHRKFRWCYDRERNELYGFSVLGERYDVYTQQQLNAPMKVSRVPYGAMQAYEQYLQTLRRDTSKAEPDRTVPRFKL